MTDDEPLLREPHKQHFACFACRKAFKQPGSETSGVEAERPFPCPQCGEPMAVVGRDFQAPPQRAEKQWLLVEVLHSFGVIFEPGTTMPRTMPKSSREVEDFLTAQGYDVEVVRKRTDALRRRRERSAPPRRKPSADRTSPRHRPR